MTDVILHSARLELRPFGEADADDMHRLWTDPDVRRYLWDDQIIPLERVLEVIQASLDDFRSRGLGLWTLALAGTDRSIGFCGLRPFGESEEIEVLYGLAPDLWGKGLATEAARRVLRFGFVDRNLPRIFGRTDPPNVASQRVLDRLGMRFVRRHRENGLDTLEYVLPCEAFFAAA